MTRLLFVVIVGLLIVSLGGPYAYASCGSSAGKCMQQGKAINTTCPVMGTTISGDTPYRVEYKGKEVGFCCAQCVAAFNANPEKYASKIKDAAENK